MRVLQVYHLACSMSKKLPQNLSCTLSHTRTHIHTHTQTDTDTDRQTDRQTDRHIPRPSDKSHSRVRVGGPTRFLHTHTLSDALSRTRKRFGSPTRSAGHKTDKTDEDSCGNTAPTTTRRQQQYGGRPGQRLQRQLLKGRSHRFRWPRIPASMVGV